MPEWEDEPMSKPDLRLVRQRPRMPGAAHGSAIERLDVFAQRLAALHDSGLQAVFAEAEHSLAELAGGRSGRILLESAVGWRDWHQLDVAIDSAREDALPAAQQDAEALPALHDGRLTLPIRAGSILAWIDGIATPPDLQAMALAARYVDLAIAIGERHESAARNTRELQVLQDVATRILRSADLDEILLLVTHETKRLLASDICGVLMLEDEELVMRCCVGHFSVETAKLRMHAGIGVAGRALATDSPCCVENYVESEAISQDFMPLARAEKVRSALAVPIRAREATIGVLEVWRRRPSLYNEQDHGLLLALSGLAALAIDNARLLQSRARAAEKLAHANGELARRIRALPEAGRADHARRRRAGRGGGGDRAVHRRHHRRAGPRPGGGGGAAGPGRAGRTTARRRAPHRRRRGRPARERHRRAAAGRVPVRTADPGRQRDARLDRLVRRRRAGQFPRPPTVLSSRTSQAVPGHRLSRCRRSSILHGSPSRRR
jgi:GAF domain-containing protein